MTKSIKDCAKRNDIRSMKVLAKEIVNSRKVVSRLYHNKAQMNSVSMMLTEQLATVRSVGHITKSTEVLKAMNGLIKHQQVTDTMRDMSKEMMKSGLIEEMLADALDDGMEDIETETDEEVNKILAELAGEHMASMPAAETHTLAAPKVAETPRQEAEDSELNNLQARLDAIRQEAS